jgi:hypothetical protein
MADHLNDVETFVSQSNPEPEEALLHPTSNVYLLVELRNGEPLVIAEKWLTTNLP